MKQLRLSAVQQRVLDAFQENDWPNSMDYPITASSAKTRTQQLRDAVCALNEHHAFEAIVFFFIDKTHIGWRQKKS